MVKVTISTEEGRTLVEHIVQPEPAETDEHLAEEISEMIQINFDVKETP